MANSVCLRDLQLAELDILIETIKILKRYNLRYSMIGGTMLGAIRHKGFIPWDDDIDIALPRKDYERFLDIAEKELPKPYAVLRKFGKHECMYAKIHNTDTTFIESSTVGWKDYYKGVFIDIMPLDGMPSSEKARKKYCKRIGNLVKTFNWHRFNFKYCKSLKAKLCYLIPEKWIFKKWKKLITKYDFDVSDYTCFAWSHRPGRLTFQKELFTNLAKYEFENIEVCGCQDYDGYLKSHFGTDYMVPPPENKRGTHNNGNGIVDLNKSYLIYLQEGRQK